MSFDFLRRLLGARPPPADGGAVVQGGSEISLLLERAWRARCLLAVTVHGHSSTCNSAILEVARDGGYFVLDELVPGTGHAAMEASREIDVRTIVEGIELRFRSRVLAVGASDGLPFYTVAFPDAFAYAQRRARHRVRTPLHGSVRVTLLLQHGREVVGELRDLSPDGLSARVHAGRLDPSADLNATAVCRLELAREHSILADVELRYISAALPPRVARFGGRFVGMTRTASSRVEELCEALAQLRTHHEP